MGSLRERIFKPPSPTDAFKSWAKNPSVTLTGCTNRTVDAADFTVGRDRLGRPDALPNDDTTGVDFDNFDRWKANLGATVGSGASLYAAMPEPSSLLLLILAAASWSLRRPVLRRDF
jgi:hypothetical protein